LVKERGQEAAEGPGVVELIVERLAAATGEVVTTKGQKAFHPISERDGVSRPRRETGVAAMWSCLDAGDDVVDPAPGSGRVVNVLEAPDRGAAVLIDAGDGGLLEGGNAAPPTPPRGCVGGPGRKVALLVRPCTNHSGGRTGRAAAAFLRWCRDVTLAGGHDRPPGVATDAARLYAKALPEREAEFVHTSSEESSRITSGIPGLDDILTGGLPRNTLLLVEGRPGSGKTTIALQFLLQGVREGETCLLVTNAESARQLDWIAASHGWSLAGIHVSEWREPTDSEGEGAEDYTLFPEAEVEVGETLQYLYAEVERVQPSLLVIDTISALRVLAPTPAFYRRQLRRIREFLSTRSCTTFILDDGSTGEKDARSQTLADGIIELHQVDFNYGMDRRRLRVRKLRGSTYVSGAHDFTITTGGIVLYPRLVARAHARGGILEPLSSTIAELDGLSGGGLPRGSSTLMIGPAGTGKSTLATIYAMAAAGRGEKCCILLLDESIETHVVRSRGLGLGVGAAMETGAIRMQELNAAELSPGQIAHLLVRQVEEEKVGLVVIDTLNGYLHSAMDEPSVLLHLRELVAYLGRRGVVTLMTLTQHGIFGPAMLAPMDVSYLADNVFLLRYFEESGGIRQALSMVKKRTGRHERTIRELVLAPGKVSLGPPLREFSGILTGTPNYRGSNLPAAGA
jgi:circadian clock protein KaiC